MILENQRKYNEQNNTMLHSSTHKGLMRESDRVVEEDERECFNVFL